MPFADLEGHRFYFEDTGGDKPVIVFSHGLLMDHTMFASQVDMLRDNWRCITWDGRGHGLTGQVPKLSPFTFWDLARDLKALLTHLGVERAVLVGASQGGYLSVRCTLLFPNLVRALILSGARTGPEDPQQMVGYRALGDFWLQNGPSEMLVGNAERILLGKNWPGAAVWGKKWWHFSPRHFLECLNTFGEREDITHRLAEIKVPVMVIHGEADVAVPLAPAQALAAGLHGELVVVPGAGHTPMLTDPEPVNAAIARFLADLPA